MNIITILSMALDGNLEHWDPDMWSHMFPLGFYGMPMMWLWIVLFVVIVSATVSIVLYILLKEQQQGQA